jgi:hypothetical protein
VNVTQYTLPLPADYDMRIIRERVRTRSHMTDGYAGLGFKAYLMRERGVDGSPVNSYGSFYVWNDTEGMNRFFWGGGGFGGIVTDFGRPPVQHWIGVALAAGPARRETPLGASRSIEQLAAGADPAEAVTAARAALELRAGTPGVHSTLVAVDPQRWSLVHFTLWSGPAPEDGTGDRHQVLHLSEGTDPC